MECQLRRENDRGAAAIVGLAAGLSGLFGLLHAVIIASLFGASMAAIELTRLW